MEEKRVIEGAEREKVLNKLRALLAMRDGKAGSPEEAANAAQRVQEILNAYHLSEADAREKDPQRAPDEAVTFKPLDADAPRQHAADWQALLAVTLAEHFYCKAIAMGGEYGRRVLWLVGRESDRQTVAYMYRYLERELDRLARVSHATQGAPSADSFFDYEAPTEKADKVTPFEEWIEGFTQGAVTVIHMRLEAMRKDVNLALTASQALVLDRRRMDVEAFTTKLFGDSLKPDASFRFRVNSGHAAGRRAGHVLNLGGDGAQRLGE